MSEVRTALHHLVDERRLDADAFDGRPLTVVQPAIMAALRPGVGRASISALRKIDVWRIGHEPRLIEWREDKLSRFVLLHHVEGAMAAQYAHWSPGGCFVSKTAWLVSVGMDGTLAVFGPALPHERETVLRGVAAALLLPYAQARVGDRFVKLPKDKLEPRGLNAARAKARRKIVPAHDWLSLPPEMPLGAGVEFIESRVIETPRGCAATMPHFAARAAVKAAA